MSDQEIMASERESVLRQLREHGKDIGAAAATGDRRALAVMQAYEMWQSCPGDMFALGLVSLRLSEWQKSRP